MAKQKPAKEMPCCETKVFETQEGARIEIEAKGPQVKKAIENLKNGDFSACGCCCAPAVFTKKTKE